MNEHVEKIIDAMGVDQLLHTIAQICSDKAEHIRANWQDRELAKHWDKRSNKITNLANEI